MAAAHRLAEGRDDGHRLRWTVPWLNETVRLAVGRTPADPVTGERTLTVAPAAAPSGHLRDFRATVRLGPVGGDPPRRLRLAVAFGDSLRDETEAAPEDGGGKRWRVYAPARQESIPLARPLLTPFAGLLFLGRLLDAAPPARPGRPRAVFTCLTDYGFLGGPFCPDLALTDEGTEQIVLLSGPVRARRWRFALSHRDAGRLRAWLGEDRPAVGRLWTGPRGEVLRHENARLFGVPRGATVEARGPAEALPDGSRVWRPAAARSVLVARATPAANGGWTVTWQTDGGGMIVFRERLARDLRALSAEAPDFRPPWTAVVERPNRLVARAAAGERARVDAPSGRIWSPAHWFAPELWEEGAWAGMAVGESRAGDYLPLRRGVPHEATPFTLERLPDRRARVGAAEIVARHYRMTNGGDAKRGDGQRADFFVHEGRLLAAFGEKHREVGTILGEGWETAAERLREDGG